MKSLKTLRTKNDRIYYNRWWLAYEARNKRGFEALAGGVARKNPAEASNPSGCMLLRSFRDFRVVRGQKLRELL
jgi:hypothetical protein